MTTRRPLTHCGADVALVGRYPDGSTRAVAIDREGRPLGFGFRVWPHDLRGVGWHIAEIKAACAAACLRIEGDDSASAPTDRGPAPSSGAGRRLHAHHSVPEEDR